MSELGVAVYDPRDSAGSPLYTIEERLQKIHVRHYVAYRWRKITPLTCDAFMHTTWPGKPGRVHEHVAHPYDGVFARSRIRTHLQIRDGLQQILNRLPTRCLTAEEIAQGQRRPVVILFWDAKLEVRIMSQWKITIPASQYPDPEVASMRLWDLQKWYNLQQAKKNAAVTDSAYNLLKPLGILACGHNAGNDVFAFLGAFLYLLHCEEGAWTAYMEDFDIGFSEEYRVRLDWVDPDVAEYNQRLDPSWEGAVCGGCFL